TLLVVRVRHEANVPDDVGIDGEPIFVSEGRHAQLHVAMRVAPIEELQNTLLELRKRQVRGVDNLVGKLFDLEKLLAFLVDASLDACAERMATARLGKPPQERT